MDSLKLILCAVAAASLDICALVLILAAYHERSTGNKRWNRMTSFMDLLITTQAILWDAMKYLSAGTLQPIYVCLIFQFQDTTQC